jgi:hypothetical protein
VNAEKEYRASGGQCFIDGQWRYLVDKDKADAFISELQARNEVQRVHLEKLLAEPCQKTCLQRDALIDELDEMKARRCETCRYSFLERIAGEEDTDMHGIGDKLYDCKNGVAWYSDCPGENPADFWCSLWSARQDGERVYPDDIQTQGGPCVDDIPSVFRQDGES